MARSASLWLRAFGALRYSNWLGLFQSAGVIHRLEILDSVLFEIHDEKVVSRQWVTPLPATFWGAFGNKLG